MEAPLQASRLPAGLLHTGEQEKLLFVYCTLTFPHPPHRCDRPWYGITDREALPPRVPRREDSPSMIAETVRKIDLDPRWPEERWNELCTTYLDMCSKFDSQLGQLVGKLKETGLFDDTSVFVFSDHGGYTCDYGLVEKVQNCFEDALVNIPLIVKPAKGIECKPRVNLALVELNDLCVTLSDMTGVDLGYVQYGTSLLPVFAGDDAGKDAVFSEGGRGFGDRPSMELGHDDPYDMYWLRISTQHEEGPNHTRAMMMRIGNLKYTMRLYERDTLYDLDLDPHEQVKPHRRPGLRREGRTDARAPAHLAPGDRRLGTQPQGHALTCVFEHLLGLFASGCTLFLERGFPCSIPSMPWSSLWQPRLGQWRASAAVSSSSLCSIWLALMMRLPSTSTAAWPSS